MNTNLSQIRDQFLSGNVHAARNLSKPIYDSWLRCSDRAQEMGARLDYEYLDRIDIEQAKHQHSQLLSSSAPHLHILHSSIANTGWSILLTDTYCNTLKVMRSEQVKDPRINRAFEEGLVLSEKKIGTSAMSCALASGQLVRVFGEEHYSSYHHSFNCAAVPIYDSRGNICSTLNITNENPIDNPAVFYLLQSTSRSIQNELILRIPETLSIEMALQENRFGEKNNPIIALSYDLNMKGCNEAASRFIFNSATVGSFTYEAIFNTPFTEILDKGVLRGQSFRLQLNNGIQLFARVLSQTKTLPHKAVSLQIPAPKAQIQPEISFGDSETDQRVLKAATLASRLPILIQGESGVGKEIAAQQIHRLSSVSTGPLISLNCASIPSNLIESELFGYQPGAFTGANTKGHKGLVEQADGGTLFLDEIGDMPIELQTRLLRVLETKEISPLGSAQRKHVKFQLICATHVNLQQAVTEGKFRSDLYYRIKGFALQIKPLRERSDKLGLVQSLLAEVSQNHQPRILSEPLTQFINKHNWPGNIRELKNLLIQLDALSDATGVLDCTHLPDEYRNQCTESSTKTQRSMFERAGDHLIEETLARRQGNISAVARELGVSRSTLYRRLKRGQ